jgi:hypothetical protein
MNISPRRLPAIALCATLFASGNALAHSDDYHDSQTAPNGGQIRTAGAYHFELVMAKNSLDAQENPVIVHVTDHAYSKVPTAGAHGIATLLSGKQKINVKLTPDGENRLKGFGKYASAPEMKVVVSITWPGKAAEQARFTPLATEKNTQPDHKH